ncbi:Histone acetyltransferase mst1 [Schizosaccharomyces pombe]|uniref:Histone acetyltransferase mst1 n=1 Tax=Schizosaccharomyces pombe (strain 972 / ATCC 24843) TaxID=284812 RepID=ESA1_SCHPO|nr:KAT5 family histone acetyltransferase Mst1 [Schizosaccharomyces pombe]O94446.1 RecName: Full=Histone acetyltransferase mst1; AltName: Full=Protein 2-hydroxyisobutyryltransferase mst1; AltName: Full=Protein acetyltransferase mst1; AltName: Full=Protein crotonyltransferase mst1 [Schizosaccharomyces pombe 972h-]CAA22591.1 KAT5 family histone acetyltransferase Mst1 [Schizosaccharomyces pombe]|eukprot:NP_594630.1 KAT5 family histone acetyltransferase Mst1 [Schizosaccharomyces pombe]
MSNDVDDESKIETKSYEAKDIVYKSKVFAFKDGEYRKAEILMIQKRTRGVVYYVHYNDYNKRLDEWITIDNIDLSKGIEYPPPEKPKKAHGKGKSSKRPKAVDRRRSITAPSKTEPSTPSTEKPEPSTPSGESDHGSNAGNESLPLLEEDHKPESLSKEQEVERLRFSGSMVQNPHEIARIRNINKICIGDHEIEPWYFSPYPKEFSEVDIVYICSFCFCYYGSERQFQRHREKCTLQHPPGNEIYRDDYISFFEIDGRKQRTWCRNICLLSKLFLDHKMLYYDVDPFLFYCMCRRDEYGCHLVGYFSKEKESSENYNLACILTLPQYQRHGYGKLLIQFSYELTKREHKHGSPEKPLSDLGLISYRAYWAEQIINLVLGMRTETTIDELANKTSMTTNDVLHTLQALNMLKYYKGQFIICISDGIEQQYERLKNKKRRRINGDLLADWQPPVFHPSQLRFGW